VTEGIEITLEPEIFSEKNQGCSINFFARVTETLRHDHGEKTASPEQLQVFIDKLGEIERMYQSFKDMPLSDSSESSGGS